MSPLHTSRPGGVDRPLRAIHVVVAEMATLVRLVPLLVELGTAPSIHRSTYAFLAVERHLEAGLVLCDAGLPDISGLSVRLAERRSEHEVVLLPPLETMTAPPAGSDGHEPTKWTSAVRTLVHSHGIRSRSHCVNVRMARLSPREHEVLELILAGLPSKGIADELGVKKRTVDNHRQHIMNKLEVHSVAELVREALRGERYRERFL